MSELRAFVGHSFSDNDKEIVRPILDYLDQIKEMGIGFSWKHAKQAEPKVLAEKVLALIENMNLFIGICTKKERVVDQGNLNRRLLCPGVLCAKDGNFSWKTSDWVIQEIGLAIGKGMDVMLIVEEGLKSPGGLQGDLECIHFNRENPEKSFGKILEMITALTFKAKPTKGLVAEKPESTEDKEPKEEGYDSLNPKQDWKRRDYDFALMHMVASEDKEGEERIYKAYLDNESAQEEDKADIWNATKEYYHIIFAEDGSLEKLKRIAKEKLDNSEIQRLLAKAYQQYGENVKAAKAFLKSSSNESDKKRKLLRMGNAAVAYAKAKKDNELRNLIEEIKIHANSIDDGEISLLNILIEVMEIKKNKILYLAFIERLLDLKPGDNKSRFNLAYGHSEEGRNEMVLFHYLKIPNQNRDAVTWNNIGVAYNRLDILGKAVSAYRIAEKNEETLAMDNIARKYLEVGFFSEAQQQCDKAKQKKDYNKNVDDTLFRLKNMEDEERKKEGEILEKIRSTHEFYVDYGRAAAKENLTELTGDWNTKLCKINIIIKDGKLRGIGMYEVSSIGNIFSKYGLDTSTEKLKYKVYYDGQLMGYTVKGTIRIIKMDKAAAQTNVLSLEENKKDVLMVISDDLTKIKVYQENATDDSQKFEEINKE